MTNFDGWFSCSSYKLFDSKSMFRYSAVVFGSPTKMVGCVLEESMVIDQWVVYQEDSPWRLRNLSRPLGR